MFTGPPRQLLSRAMRPAWKWRLAILSAVAVLGSLIFLLVPSGTVLVLRSDKTGEVRYRARVAEGEEFMIAYVHSVNRRPVQDTLRIEGKGLRIVKSRFDAFGAGMPDTSTAENPLRIGPDGWLEYTVDRAVDDVTVFVGRVAGHTLHIGRRAIPLAELDAPGNALRFSVERQSPLQRWRTELNHE